MLVRGCDVLLANVVVTSEQSKPILVEMPVKNEFSDVFPDEVPSLPRDREEEGEEREKREDSTPSIFF